MHYVVSQELVIPCCHGVKSNGAIALQPFNLALIREYSEY